MNQPRKSFAEMRRELAEKRGRTIETEAPSAPPKPAPQVEDDLVPDVLGERSEDDIEVDSIIASIDVLDAYRRWIGKEVDERTTGSKEGLKVSCPIPGHRDKNPSAWLNTEKKTWFCGGCQEGGDLYDLAAIKFGYPRPDYKEGKTFHELRQEMAESYGYRFKKVAGQEIIWREEEVSQPAESTRDEDNPVAAVPNDEGTGVASEAPQEDAEAPAAPVVSIVPKLPDEEDAETITYPVLDWRSIVPEGTFLWEYMSACSNDDSPEEYHFWHGLLALGHAVGRKVSLDDEPPVYGNLLVCLLGGTGYGKSRSRRWLTTVLREAAPWNREVGTGVKMCPTPGSGENMIKQFAHEVEDPTNAKRKITVPVNGIVDYSEFAALLARASRPGMSHLKNIIMDFSDCMPEVSNSSNTGGEFIAEDPFCSITTTTQPKAVRPLLSRTDQHSGFLNRWLFVGGPKKKSEVMGGSFSTMRVDLGPAIEELKKIRGWGAMSRVVEFDTRNTWDQFREWIRSEIHTKRDADETEMLVRLDLTMKRMLLLFAINERRTVLTPADFPRLAVIAKYLIDCYGILSNEIGITQMQEVMTEALRHIERIQAKTGRGATARELSNCMKRKNFGPELINKTLKTMVELDLIDIDKTKGPGRPTIRYRMVAS